MKKRLFLKNSSATALALAMVAAGTASGELFAQTRTVTWLTHPAIYAATGDGELLKKFEQQTGIKVEVTTLPTETLRERVQTEFVGRSAAYDVINVADAFWTTALARFVEPLDARIKSSPPPGGMADFAPSFVDQFRIPQTSTGVVYGLPNRMSMSLLFYRKDLLQKAGVAVPKTLDEFARAAKKLSEKARADGNKDLYGAVFQGMQGQAGVLDWYEYASPAGSDLLTAPDWKKSAFNSPEGIKALQIRRQLIADGSTNSGVLSYGFDDTINAMAQGKAAMSIMYSAYWSKLEDTKSSQVAGKIGYAAPPRDPKTQHAYPARGWALMINGASARKDAAWELIKFLTAPEQQLWMAVNKGNPVSRLSVTRMAEFKAAVPIAEALGAAMPFSKIMPNIPTLPRVYDVMSQHLANALSGKATAADALKAAGQEVDDLMK